MTMQASKQIKRLTIYYLIFCGFMANFLVLLVYLYQRPLFYTVYEKIEQKLGIAGSAQDSATTQKNYAAQLEREIEQNFGAWQPPVSPPSVEAGQILIGAQKYPSLAAASKALTEGQELLIGPGIYKEPLIITSNDVKVTGSGTVVFDGVAADGKAAIITKGNNITVSNIECKNIAVSDQNGACIRSEGKKLTVDHVYFHDAEQGVLTSSNKYIYVLNSRFERLGKNGQAHGIYVDGGELLIDNSLFIASVSEGHEIKSRAVKTVISNSIIASLSANDSRLIDIPNGGELSISHTVLEKGPNSFNSSAIGYGLEGIKHSFNQITLNRNFIILERNGFNELLRMDGGKNVALNITDNIIIAEENPNLDGNNWIFSNREEAKIDQYPNIPKLQYNPLK